MILQRYHMVTVIQCICIRDAYAHLEVWDAPQARVRGPSVSSRSRIEPLHLPNYTSSQRSALRSHLHCARRSATCFIHRKRRYDLSCIMLHVRKQFRTGHQFRQHRLIGYNFAGTIVSVTRHRTIKDREALINATARELGGLMRGRMLQSL